MSPQERERLKANGFTVSWDYAVHLLPAPDRPITTRFYFFTEDVAVFHPSSTPICAYDDTAKVWHIVPNTMLPKNVKPEWWETFARSFDDLSEAMAYMRMLNATKAYAGYEARA